ncbi:Lin0368 family putative glycerol transporter subunit [uncultured Clostridium sp.]|uniref:Lin0368 family putative glycerol transporter subunit n=1 Tax=uncultured Clostridium sp. TaxID=59620 RepID=UPI0025F295BD|nr:hypothetical protein [uncultured Clostridium sp.]
MDIHDMVTTIIGAGIFTFIVIILWDKFVNRLGAIGGFIAAMVIPGTMWILNHGTAKHLIQQSGNVWIDMAWAVGIGVLVSSIIQGGNFKKSRITMFAAIVAGIVAGYMLT